MIEPTLRIKQGYNYFAQLLEIYEKDCSFQCSAYLYFKFNLETWLHRVPDLDDTFNLLSDIFTAYFFHGYRNELEMLRLTMFVYSGGIVIKKIPFDSTLVFKGVPNQLLHHDSDVTLSVLSQFSSYSNPYVCDRLEGPDIIFDGAIVEVGDTKVSKAYLDLDENDLFIVPIYRKNKIKYFSNIYKFNKGPNWNDVQWWMDQEQKDSHKKIGKLMENIKWLKD